MNIGEGVALCPGCGVLSPLSELVQGYGGAKELLQQPPDGCKIESNGSEIVATASLRSFSSFLGVTAIALFWNGIVSVFVLVALAGLYTNLVGPLPNWFPAPDLNEGKPEINGEPMGLGMTLFLCIFLIPFVTIGTGMIITSAMYLFGKVELVVNEFGAYVATGIGFLKWKRKFEPDRVRSVGFGTTMWQSEGASNTLIELIAERTIKFGSWLQPDRMEWMRVVLKELFLKKQKSSIFQLPWIDRKSL